MNIGEYARFKSGNVVVIAKLIGIRHYDDNHGVKFDLYDFDNNTCL